MGEKKDPSSSLRTKNRGTTLIHDITSPQNALPSCDKALVCNGTSRYSLHAFRFQKYCFGATFHKYCFKWSFSLWTILSDKVAYVILSITTFLCICFYLMQTPQKCQAFFGLLFREDIAGRQRGDGGIAGACSDAGSDRWGGSLCLSDKIKHLVCYSKTATPSVRPEPDIAPAIPPSPRRLPAMSQRV